jgi:acyl transferase domain-containing protein
MSWICVGQGMSQRHIWRGRSTVSPFYSITLRTACSSALVGLNEACMTIAKGDCESAIVGGTNLILAPTSTTRMSDQGILSTDGFCKTFSAEADGYSRGEAVVSIYIKSLHAALRDGNPIRSVISGCASNFDGRTNPLTMPSATAQEALIRRTYEVAGSSDFSKTALFECHGTGTATGDPIETKAVAAAFGSKEIYLSGP